MFKRKLIYTFIVLAYAHAAYAAAPAVPAIPPMVMQGAEFMAGVAQRAANAAAERMDRMLNENQHRRNVLRNDQERWQRTLRNNPGSAEAQQRLAAIEADLARLDRDDDNARERGNQMIAQATSTGLGMLTTASNAFADKMRAEDNRRQAVAAAAATQDVANEGMLKNIEMLTSKENITKVSLAAAGIGGALIATYFAAKFGLYYAQKFIGMPKLVRESSDKNLWQTFVSLFSSEEEAVDFMSQVVFDEELTAIITDLAKAAQETKQDGIPFRNLLLYGEPGTGKTMIAKLIARHCGMNYVIISGADFIQFGEGAVQQIHELFDRIENSDIPYIVFIDEATSAFRAREGKDLVRDAIVDAILSRTGTKSNKFMLILAANDVNLDWAVISRISKRVHVPLPGINERIRIIQLYLTKYFIDNPTVLDGEQVMIDSAVNEENLRKIAQELTGYSGRDLEDLIGELRYVLSHEKSRTVTPKIIKIAADEKLKQRAELLAYDKQRVTANNKAQG